MKSVMKNGAFGTAGASLVAMLIAMPAAAQTTTPTDTTPTAKKDDSTVVVVTGTLLRGKAPVGTNLISVGQDAITKTGATTSDDLLASIPQVANFFNSVPTTGLGLSQIAQVARPNLRNLPGGSLATGAATLVLVDGHRVAGEGVTTLAVDPDLIPTGAIDHVEIVTDGGSATYGADAIGGVINFITRHKFDGVKVDAQYGTADNYTTYDANVIAGKTWSGGSGYISASYGYNDPLYGRDRSYVKRLDYSVTPATPSGTQCDLANITTPGLYLAQYNFTLPGSTYAYPGLVANTENTCDPTKDATIVPEVKHGGVFAGWSQDLNDQVKLDVRAFYSQRNIYSNNGPLDATASVPSTNPYYIPIAASPGATQQVSFSFGPALGDSSTVTSAFHEAGSSASLTVNLNDNWELRSLTNASASDSTYFQQDTDPGLLSTYGNGTTTATAIDPYNISATANKQLLANLVNYGEAGSSRDMLLDERDIVDGTLLNLPGGELKLAAGVELQYERFELKYGAGQDGFLQSDPYTVYNRHVGSIFGEMQVPIIGGGNELPGVHSLVLSLSGRYDKYSDFGSTTNPKIGLNYQPINWVTIYGNYGTSFNAPTPVDQLGSLANSIFAVPFAAAVKPGDTAATGSWTIALEGSQSNLKPQTADTWSVGFNVKPPVIPGLMANFSYYNIYFKGTLGKPAVYDPTLLFTEYPNDVILHPTDAQLQAAGVAAAGTGGVAQIAPFLGGARNVYELIDYRTANLGNTKLDGLDFQFNYSHNVGFGTIDAAFGGSYELSSKSQVSSVAPFTNDLADGVSRLRTQTSLGTNIGAFRAQVTFDYNSGYDVIETSAVPQNKVGSFGLTNLFFKYSFSDMGALKDTDLTFNIDNVFNRNPPISLASGGNGYENGFTLGRLFKLGLSKKF